MEDNFLEQIKEAELKAEQIISDAQKKAAQIELDATKEIESYRNTEQSKLFSETEEISFKATQKANDEISGKRNELLLETDKLSDIANKNMESAVSFIIDKVLD